MKKVSLLHLLAVLLAACGLLALFLGLNASARVAYAGDNIWTWVGLSGYPDQIVTDPLSPGRVVALLNGSDVMASLDGGASWTEIGDPAWQYVRRIAMAPGEPDILFAVTSAGVFRSVDAGDHWQRIHPTAGAFTLAVSPADWKEIYLGSTVISKTVDGGQTWFTVSEPLAQDYMFMHIAIAPSAPHIVIATPWNTSTLLPWISTDAGQNWTEMAGAPTNINAVVFDPASSNKILIATIGLAWKTSDGGLNWQPVANGLAPFAFDFVIDPDNTQVIHAADGPAGVLESLDGGASWTPINTGIQGLAVNSLAIASRNPLTIYAGVQGGGIWKLTRNGLQDYGLTINQAALFTNQTSVTLTLTAAPGTTRMQVSNDGGFTGAEWEDFQGTKAWTVTAYESAVIPRTVYVKFLTNGQVSAIYQDDIILDQTPPNGSVEIDAPPAAANGRSGAMLAANNEPVVYLPLTAYNYIPGMRSIRLILSASDDVSGVDGMRVSNQANFSETPWQSFTPRLDWSVAEEGAAMVYVQYRDRAGNLSEVYSVTAQAP